MKKKLFLLFPLLLCGCLIFAQFLPQEEIYGHWESDSGQSLEISETTISIGGKSYAYELGKDGVFVLDSGIFGPLKGTYRLENSRLYLNVHGVDFCFHRATP